MCLLKDLENTTSSERDTLKKIILSRIEELTLKRDDLQKTYDCNDSNWYLSKIREIDKLIKFNTYMFHWLENPTTKYLQ